MWVTWCICGDRHESSQECATCDSVLTAMVCCDRCDRWSHMACVGIMTQQQIPGTGNSWFCHECSHCTSQVPGRMHKSTSKHKPKNKRPKKVGRPRTRQPLHHGPDPQLAKNLAPAERAKPTPRMIAAAAEHKTLSSTRGGALPYPVSAKVRGVRAAARMSVEVSDQIDACDDYFQWYPSRVVSLNNNSALVRFGEYPARFNTWVPLNCGRMAPLNTFTQGRPQDPKTVGTTANIPIATTVLVHLKSKPGGWEPCRVEATSPDGESVCVATDLVSEGAIWIDIRSGTVAVHSPVQTQAEAKAKYKLGKVTQEAAAAGYHAFIVRNVRFEVPRRYVEPNFIGMGAYGCVCSAQDSELGGTVAIKKVFDLKSMDQEDLSRTLNEIKVCLLYTSDAADEEDSVDLGGRRIIKKKKQNTKCQTMVTIEENWQHILLTV
eukprot:TRINITY_DN22821_c0_g1_i1.p1 TRINITY_DN22821_c0_g1~~TRINITY_DN22821_c0_g1_i1.p1  ORF type:complete len:434 (+),score=50.03 TRINITY_DN22821_c0_g1_i1:225-1526(+)